MMNENRFIAGIKVAFLDVLLPIVVYILVTIFVSGISGAIDYFFSYKLNIIIVTAISSLLTTIILLPRYIRIANNRNYHIDKFDIKNMRYILGLGVSLCLFFNIALILLNIIQNDQAAIQVSDSIMELNPLVAFISVSIIVPMCEELIFRGFVFKGIEHKTNFIIGAFVSSILFALMHGNISQGIYAFCIGFVLCYVYNRFGGLKYSYLLHLVMNFSSLVFMPAFVPDEALKRDQLIVLIVSFVLFIITAYRLKQTEIKKEVM